jgi:hypothetical protein
MSLLQLLVLGLICTSPLGNPQLLTERTRLSGTACELIELVANQCAHSNSVDELFVPTLIKLTARTNKIMFQRANTALTAVVQHGNPDTILPKLAEAIKNNSKSVRVASIDGIKALMGIHSSAKLEHQITALESSLKTACQDSAADVRQKARAAIEEYAVMFPNRARGYV